MILGQTNINCDEKFKTVLKLFRSKEIAISGQVVYKCSATNLAIYEWKIRLLNEPSMTWLILTDEIREKMILSHGNALRYNKMYKGFNIRRIAFPKATLQIGIHEFCLNVTMYQVPGNYNFALII